MTHGAVYILPGYGVIPALFLPLYAGEHLVWGAAIYAAVWSTLTFLVWRFYRGTVDIHRFWTHCDVCCEEFSSIYGGIDNGHNTICPKCLRAGHGPRNRAHRCGSP